MSGYGPSQHFAPPHDFGRKRGIPEVAWQPSIAEGDARDPNRTFASFAGLGYTAIGESATGPFVIRRAPPPGACRFKLCGELIKPRNSSGEGKAGYSRSACQPDQGRNSDHQ